MTPNVKFMSFVMCCYLKSVLKRLYLKINRLYVRISLFSCNTNKSVSKYLERLTNVCFDYKTATKTNQQINK